jgi:hypothetical protein
MNTKLHHALTLGALLIFTAAPALAADHGAMDHAGMDHGAMGGAPAAAAEPAASASPELRKVVVSGYTLTYTLFEMGQTMQSGSMPMTAHGAPKMKSHHLMVYAVGPDGKPAAGAQAGFLIVQPDKTEVKVMAMQMGDGFGADVDLAAKGDYAITTKIALAGQNLVDTFVHTVK